MAGQMGFGNSPLPALNRRVPLHGDRFLGKIDADDG